MNSLEIYAALKNEIGFRGVFAVDEVPKLKTYPSLFVVNTGLSSTPGRHWVVVYFPVSGPNEFFDSLGKDLKHYNKIFQSILGGREYIHNTIRLQNFGSATCGEHCIFFTKHRLRGYTFKTIMLKYSLHDLSKNDAMVVKG